jgi:hypothetical protein
VAGKKRGGGEKKSNHPKRTVLYPYYTIYCPFWIYIWVKLFQMPNAWQGGGKWEVQPPIEESFITILQQ